MKLCDAPESNNITACLLWIENIPDITGAPSESSAIVVKLIRPCLTWIVCFLFLFWLEPCPWFVCLAWGHSRAKWVELPQLKQRFALPGRSGCWVFGLGPFCYGVGGRALLYCWGGLAIQRPCWGAFWEDWGVAFCTKRYLCGGALEGPTGAFLFFSALWARMQSS